ncbi:TPA: type II toxin-antitoxin system HicA family toxin [Vibrio vulnificus]|nr:addiction module toxin, HicA family [Vibrio vulnificus]HAT8539959.1 addiction module toxin, HicA family [Vibrio vulnificus]HDY7452045.1 type II toxin-antitoxin system HicA family toxin [Vibrio vulnificus]HDY7640051.1 type II toxin-antitoxin system HicA family toxin [Vibrio vulnificus]HDY7681295.1 type II toxin-antitoxin system HicA family toxin [Vibrio vulnificus]
MQSSELIKLVSKRGWELARITGSHHHFKHPDFVHILSIPHPKKDLGKGLVSKLIKDAGL